MKSNQTQFDYVVIGSGVAGLFFAHQVAQYGTVAIVTKKKRSDSNTNLAQGGIACVTSDMDNFNLHIEDTLKAGAGLCNREAVEIMIREGPDCVHELISIGANFSKNPEGSFELGREGGHSRNRIVHAKDLTGKEIEERLLETVAKQKNISIFENHLVIDLITENKETVTGSTPTCTGAWVLDNHGEIKIFNSKITLIATGGCGQLFQHTTNPSIATGDGIAIASRAGAKIKDLEFIQFHPTTLYWPSTNTFLISEALRGAGAIILNKNGEDFTKRTSPLGSLAPRDIVSRSIDEELKKTGEPCVYLDATLIPKNRLIEDFPHIYNTCLDLGLDISIEKIPIVPAAHYMCGGISADLQARTNIANLYACGEAACSGVHGANRLASNSLLEALVFSKRAAINSISMLDNIHFSTKPFMKKFTLGTISKSKRQDINDSKMSLKKIMTNCLGIVRSNEGLSKAKKQIDSLEEKIHLQFPENEIDDELCELRNMLLVSKQMIKSSMARKTNVGLHFNMDSPEQCTNNILSRIGQSFRFHELTD